MKRPKISIAVFVVAILVLVASSALGLAGWIGYRSYREQRRAELAEFARTAAEQSAIGLALPLWNFDRGEMREYIASVMRDPAVEAVTVRQTPDGKLVQAWGRDVRWEIVELDQASAPSELYSHESKISSAGDEIGAVRIDITPRFLEAKFRRVRLTILGVIAATAAVLVLTLYLLLRSTVLLPLQRLTRFALEASRAGAAPTRAPAAPLLREMAMLHASLADMVGQLQARLHELQRQTELLQASELKFRTLFESAHDAILLMSDRVILSCNPKAESLFGCAQAELVGHSPVDFSPPCQPDGSTSEKRAHDLIAGALGGQPQRFDWQHQRPDGSLFDAEVSLNRLELPGEVRLQAIVRDVTALRRAAQTAERERRFFEALFESLPGGAFVLDERGQFVRSNRWRTAFYGEARAKLPLADLAAAVCPDDSTRVLQAFKEGLSKGGSSVEFVATGVEGIAVPFLATGRALELDGQHYVVGVNIDLTERVKTETALRESEARYRALIDDISDVVYTVGTDGRITFVGPQVKRYGYTPEELIGREVATLVAEEDRTRVAAVLAHEFATGEEAHNTFRVYAKDGAKIWFEDTSRGVRDESGRIGGASGILRDVTERKRAEEERQELQSQLIQAQKMEAIGQLAGGVAHDFNNILTAILIQLSLLQNDRHITAEIRNGLRELETEAKRAASLTRQLLMFSRRQVLQPQVLELNSLLGNLLKMLRRLIGENIQLEFNGAKEDLWLEADPGMIEQVVMNLTVNARDAMARGGRVQIATRSANFDATITQHNPEASAGYFVCLSVTDTGTGMDAATLKRIFEPFFTTKEPGKGTGLGLATVYGIAKMHRGWIQVYTEVGRGSTFEVFLPGRLQTAVIDSDTAQLETVKGGSETVLLAEDEATVRRTMVLTLQRLGYRVLETVDGPTALRLWQLQRSTIDLLVTDMVMPGGMSGLDLIEQTLQQKPSLKVILVSGYSLEMVRHGLPRNLPVRYLQKPFEAVALARLVRECLDGERRVKASSA